MICQKALIVISVLKCHRENKCYPAGHRSTALEINGLHTTDKAANVKTTKPLIMTNLQHTKMRWTWTIKRNTMNVKGFFIMSSLPANLKLWFKKVRISLSYQKYKQGCQTKFKLTQAITIHNDVNTQKNHLHSRGMETTAHWGALNSYYLPNNFRVTKLQMNIEATGVPYMRKYNMHSKLLMESLKGRDHLGIPLPIVDITPVCSTAFFGQAKQSSMLWDLSVTSIPTMSSI